MLFDQNEALLSKPSVHLLERSVIITIIQHLQTGR